jgi:hypothetical protein
MEVLFGLYPNLFPELKGEVRSRATAVACCMLSMTCKTEWTAAAPARRGKLAECMVIDGWKLSKPFLKQFAVPNKYELKKKNGSFFRSYEIDHGARHVPYEFVCRLFHAAIERGCENNFVHWADDVFWAQYDRDHGCHECVRAAVCSKDMACVHKLCDAYKRGTLFQFPDYSLAQGGRLLVTTATTEWYVDSILLTYAFYEGDSRFLERLLQEIKPDRIFELNFDNHEKGTYDKPVRELSCLDSIKVLQDYDIYYAMEFLRKNLIHGMIQQHWSVAKIRVTLETYSIGAWILDGSELYTDSFFVADYMEWAIACSHPTAARYFWEEARLFIREWDYNNKVIYEATLTHAADLLRDSGQPEFRIIVDL